MTIYTGGAPKLSPEGMAEAMRMAAEEAAREHDAMMAAGAITLLAGMLCLALIFYTLGQNRPDGRRMIHAPLQRIGLIGLIAGVAMLVWSVWQSLPGSLYSPVDDFVEAVFLMSGYADEGVIVGRVGFILIMAGILLTYLYDPVIMRAANWIRHGSVNSQAK